MTRAPWRGLISMVFGAVLMLSAAAGLYAPGQAAAQEREIWGEPVNLSGSGAATQPVITAEGNRTLHALWWDAFEGTKYAWYQPEAGWSAPVTVASIIGGRSREGAISAPRELTLLADNARFTHAFWLDTDGNLMYARKQVGFSEWSGATQIATAPLAWEVSIDAANRLHVAFIRTSPIGGLAPGVYYRQATATGANWGNAVLVTSSLYFRTLAQAAAHVNVASDGAGETLVIWDDPQLGQSLYARLAANGFSFGEPQAIVAGAAAGDAPPEQARLTPLADGSFLALWRAGGDCALYEQRYTPNPAAWTLPHRVLDTLGSCPQRQRSYVTQSGGLFMIFEYSGGAAMETWDGTTWSEPFRSQIRFLHPLTQRPTVLGCLRLALLADHVAAIGCDGNGDVWVTTSQISVEELLPALTTVWTTPVILSEPVGEAGPPVMVVDADRVMHAVWSESAPSGGPGIALRYARGDGTTWSLGALVLRSPTGKAEQPALAVDAGGLLHAAWSGGDSGRIYYSQAFVRDAPAPTGWKRPVPLPAPQNVGSSPSLISDETGRLHLIYSIPLNENRGVYYLRSDDQGQSWHEPVVVFDAVAAGWAMLGETQLARDQAGRLHALWTRMALPGTDIGLGTYYTISDDDGQTWSSPFALAEGDARHGRLITTAGNTVHAVWVMRTLGKNELWHRWSRDGGLSWTEPQRVLDTTSGLVEQANLAGDDQGNVLITAIIRTVENAAELFSLQWDGQAWADRQRVALGYDATDEAGAVAVVLPGKLLGALYRIRVPYAEGGAFYSIGYTERPVGFEAPPPAPTFTPPPPPTSTPTPTQAPTAEPTATPDLREPQTAIGTDRFWWQVGSVAAGMLLISVLALARMWGVWRR